MRQKTILLVTDSISSLEEQPCVRAVRNACLPLKLHAELEGFIQRNLLTDCWRVPPNDLKANMVKTAKKLGLKKRIISRLKRLFKSKLGYKGYYLDAGELKRV